MRWAMLAALLAGCGDPGAEEWANRPIAPQGPIPEVWARAADAVWATYGRPEPRPAVEVAEGDALTCGADNGWNWGIECPERCCVGRYWWWARKAIVANPWPENPEWAAIARDTLAHELLHAAKGDARRGDVDPDHKDPEWAPGGAKDLAVQAARDVGL